MHGGLPVKQLGCFFNPGANDMMMRWNMKPRMMMDTIKTTAYRITREFYVYICCVVDVLKHIFTSKSWCKSNVADCK